MDNTMTQHVKILNGPNLNLLGMRQPDIYGHHTLKNVAQACEQVAIASGLTSQLLQTNHEGEMIEIIHAARQDTAGIIINPGAWSHTSIAILDALNAFDGPVLEVHISNIHHRETFRHHSYVTQRANGVIVGMGAHGYELAMQHMARLLHAKPET